MTDLLSMLKVSIKAFLIAGFCLVATDVAEAKTLNTSSSFIDQSTFNYFSDVYEREDYKYGIFSSEYIQNTGYNYTTYYYLCLTNSDIDISNTSSVNASCDKLIRYHRSNNVYETELLNDNKLIINDSIYYYFNDKQYIIEVCLFILALFMTVSFLYIVIKDVFGRC